MKVFNSQEILFSIIWASSLMMLITSLMLLVKLLPEPRVKETKKAVSKKQAYDTYHRGIEDFNKQSYTNAAKLLFDAFSMFENIGDFNLAGHSLIYLAEIEKLNQNNRLARSDLNLAIAYFQKGSNQRGLGKALLKLGNLAYSERKETLANTYYQEALSLLNITADELEVANCLYGLGLVATDKHLDELALNYFLKSLLLGKKHNASYLVGINLYELAMLSLNIGDKNKAIGYFTEANENFSSVNAYYKMGLVFSSLGKLYEEDHDFLIAKNNLLHALDMFRQVGSLKEEFNTLLQLRDIARMLSDFEGEKTFTKLSDEIQIRLLN